MRRNLRVWQVWVVSSAVALLAGGVLIGGDNEWVTDEGLAIELGEGLATWVTDEDSEAFDLADLADGERRTFGTGDRSIAVERTGDEVRVTETGDPGARPMTCDVSRDTCRILTFDDDPERVALVVQKSHTCTDGSTDCAKFDIRSFSSHSAGAHVLVRWADDCEGEGCERRLLRKRIQAGGPLAHRELEELVLVHGGDPEAIEILALDGAHGEITLRCPDGDATLRVDDEEADEVYLCPRHSTAMERVHGTRRIRAIRMSDEK